jgi:hypothetical protein
MRSIVVIGIALLSSLNARAQRASGTPSNEGLACFENLNPPEYPKSALQARVDGSVWATPHVSPQGAVEKIDTQVVSAWSEGPKLLTPPVEKAIRAAKIKPECAGKTVLIVFRYQLHGEETSDPKVTSRTEAPNIIWIDSQPAIATQAGSKRPTS